jgi:hypothetical protein
VVVNIDFGTNFMTMIRKFGILGFRLTKLQNKTYCGTQDRDVELWAEAHLKFFKLDRSNRPPGRLDRPRHGVLTPALGQSLVTLCLLFLHVLISVLFMLCTYVRLEMIIGR